jgi:acyl carrier protein
LKALNPAVGYWINGQMLVSLATIGPHRQTNPMRKRLDSSRSALARSLQRTLAIRGSAPVIQGAYLERSGAMSSYEIYERIAKVIVQALNVDDDRVTPAAVLQRDLGAESIDLLDIVFRLERTFRIQIPHAELFPDSIFQGDPSFVKDGMVTDAGMTELKSQMPYAELDEFNHDRQLTSVPNLFTVGLVARFVAWKLSIPRGESSSTTQANGTQPVAAGANNTAAVAAPV